MKGVRFYLEYPNEKEKEKATRKDLGNHSGNVIAVFYENNWYETFDGIFYDGLAPLLWKPNSPVCGTSIHEDFLRDKCKRISEKQAREIHPELFVILDE